MTPTEQDIELQNWLVEHTALIEETGGAVWRELEVETFMYHLRELITADRKRVDLEARLDEIKLTKDNSEESYLGEDWWADESIKDNSAHEVPLSYFENRIAELKAKGGRAMTDNTPLNTDDELRERLDIRSRLKGLSIFRLGFGFDTYELIEFILADRKKHELQATAELREELVDFAEDVLGQFGYDGKSGGLSTLEWAESIIKQHKQELEKL